MAWACVIAACAEAPSDRPFLSVAELDIDFALPVGLSPDGALSMPGVLIAGGSEPSSLRADLAEGSRLLLIGLSAAGLSAVTPRFDRGRSAALALLREPAPTCAEGALSPDARSLLGALPDDALLLEASLDTTPPSWRPADARSIELLRSFSLSIPINEEHCDNDGPGVLEPYADQPVPIAVGTEIDGLPVTPRDLILSALHRFGDDRVLLAGRCFVSLLEPGVAFRAEPGTGLRFCDPATGAFIDAMAVDEAPERQVDGAFRAYVAVRSGTITAELHELRIGASRIERVETSTVLPLNGLSSIVINPEDGRLVASTHGSFVLTKLPGGPLERGALPALTDIRSLTIALTGIATHPYALLGSVVGSFLLGDPSAKRWSFADGGGLDSTVRPRSLAFFPAPSGSELWISDSDGRVFVRRASADAFERVEVRMPAAFTPECNSNPLACGWSAQTHLVTTLATVTAEVPVVYLTVTNCRALVQIRRDGRCATFARFGALSLSLPALSYQAMHHRPGWITVVSQSGELWQLRLGE